MADDPHFTLSDRAFHLIRRDIVSGRLEPGSRLRITKMSKSYDIGASPLREALSKLSSEFLVIFEAQRGFSVAPIDAQELRDISRVRCDLESDALARAIRFGDDAWEAGIVAAFYNLSKAEARRSQNAEASIDEWEDRNREFHEALVAACDSEWLKRLRNLLYFQHERYRRISLTNPDPKRNLQAEHQAIMDATLARNTELAVRLSKEHVDLTTRAVLAVIEMPVAEAT
ncbi:FCD domain-containing protein [Hoeflea sp. WL0058]|uniref:FCD domain-containing protein n=1 Tax=Flavimaribacter sediminis TaxID=2865987 RepID=A0AAE2ZQ59_9HYPH|nr:FCD domain-containing protein [Flavimaribacter sediminis]MBW8638443.1 FCD domain-containing protein [Flavimaribacter sediminis]